MGVEHEQLLQQRVESALNIARREYEDLYRRFSELLSAVNEGPSYIDLNTLQSVDKALELIESIARNAYGQHTEINFESVIVEAARKQTNLLDVHIMIANGVFIVPDYLYNVEQEFQKIVQEKISGKEASYFGLFMISLQAFLKEIKQGLKKKQRIGSTRKTITSRNRD